MSWEFILLFHRWMYICFIYIYIMILTCIFMCFVCILYYICINGWYQWSPNALTHAKFSTTCFRNMSASSLEVLLCLLYAYSLLFLGMLIFLPRIKKTRENFTYGNDKTKSICSYQYMYTEKKDSLEQEKFSLSIHNAKNLFTANKIFLVWVKIFCAKKFFVFCVINRYIDFQKKNRITFKGFSYLYNFCFRDSIKKLAINLMLS